MQNKLSSVNCQISSILDRQLRFFQSMLNFLEPGLNPLVGTSLKLYASHLYSLLKIYALISLLKYDFISFSAAQPGILKGAEIYIVKIFQLKIMKSPRLKKKIHHLG